MQEQEQNRTEPATEFKLKEARKRGQISKSTDFNILVIVCGLLTAIAIWGEAQWTRLCELCARLFAGAATFQVDVDGATQLGGALAHEALSTLLPFAATGFAFAIVANVVQVGPILSSEPIKPKFERLNPVAGFKRLFNKRVLFEALKSVLKLGFFAAIAYAFFISLWPGLPAIAAGGLGAQMQWLGSSAVGLLFRLGLALAVVGLLDLLYVRWSYRPRHDDEPARAQGGNQAARGRSAHPRAHPRVAAGEPEAGALDEPRAGGRRADHQPAAPGRRAALRPRTDERAARHREGCRGVGGRDAVDRRAPRDSAVREPAGSRGCCSVVRSSTRPIPPEAFLDVARCTRSSACANGAEARYEVASMIGALRRFFGDQAELALVALLAGILLVLFTPIPAPAARLPADHELLVRAADPAADVLHGAAARVLDVPVAAAGRHAVPAGAERLRDAPDPVAGRRRAR